MPRPDCEPCCNPTEAARLPSSYREAVVQLLCEILAASGGGTDSVVLPQVTKAFGAITGSYVSLGFLDSTFRLSRFYINNTTDANIEVSLDGGVTTAFTAPANTATFRDLGNYTGSATTSVQIRYQAATVPSIGTAYFDGSY